MEVKNTSSKPFTVRMSYTLRWGETRVSTYVAEPLEGCIALDPDGWGGGIGLAWVTQRTEFALGIGCNPDGVMKLAVIDGDSGQEAWSGDPTQGKLRRFDREKTLVLSIDREITVAPSETEILDLFMSAAQDIKAACLDARYFGEMGFERLRISTQCQLDKLNANIPEAIGGHESLGPLVRRNRLFSYFYSLGRTLDTEEICPGHLSVKRLLRVSRILGSRFPVVEFSDNTANGSLDGRGDDAYCLRSARAEHRHSLSFHRRIHV